MKNILVLVLLIGIFGCEKQVVKSHQLLIKNTQSYMPDGSIKKVDILIEGGVIIQISPQIDSAAEKVIDAENNFVMPGLIDAHAHFEGIGDSKSNLNLLGTTSWQEILTKVEQKVKATPKGDWIIGRGWHQDKWTDQPKNLVEGFPSHEELSAISPDNPIILSHASGHGILVNAKAMELAEISTHTDSPAGGIILKDGKGEPIGIFQENAELLITEVYDKEIKNLSKQKQYDQWLNRIKLAEEECLRYGITSLHDAGINKQNAFRFMELAENNELNVRLYSMLAEAEVRLNSSENELNALKSYENDFFSCKAIKAYMDGALGSRGAWLIEDYHDLPGYSGENVTPIEDLKTTAKIAHENNMQLCIHAIGDKGNREVINVFETEMNGSLRDARWRIEHAQHLHPDDIKRIGELGIVASMQTVHCTSDSPFVEKRLGKQRAEEGAYVWQTLLSNNVAIANGTDSPVESVNPFDNIYAAVTRKRQDSDEAFYPDQKLTRQQALDSYTKWNAYAAFQEEQKGSIEVGKLADLVILDQNLLTCEEKDIPKTKVIYTIVDGVIKYKSK